MYHFSLPLGSGSCTSVRGIQILGVVEFATGCIKLFDSLRGGRQSQSTVAYGDLDQSIKRWASAEYHRSLDYSSCGGNLQSLKWSVVVNPTHRGERVPQQANTHDCGVFVIMFARHVVAEIGFDFDSMCIRRFLRPMLTLECACGRMRTVQLWQKCTHQSWP